MSTNNTKQAAWIAIGSIASFGFGILSSMILSRNLSKGDYGTYRQVIYIYETLLVIFTLGLPRTYSYFLPRVRSNQAVSLIKKISTLFLLFGLFFSLVLFFGAGIIADVMNNPNLKEGLKYFAIAPTLMLPTMGMEGILSTYKKAKLIAAYNVATRVMMLSFVAFPVLLFDMGYKEAIIGFVIASFISFIFAELLIFFPLRYAGTEKCNVSYKEIFGFSLPLMAASLGGTLSVSADQFFISRYFGTETFAEFANGNMELPFVGMIVSACAIVLSPVFSRQNFIKASMHNDVYPLWRSAFEKSAMLIYPLVLYAIFFADYIMQFLFGWQYAVSANYFRIKTFVSFFNIIAIAPLLVNIGKVHFYAYVQIGMGVMIVLMEYICVHIVHIPYLISIINVSCTIMGILIYLNVISKIFEVSFVKLVLMPSVIKIVLLSLPILLSIKVLVDILNVKALWGLLISSVLYVIVFYFGEKKLGLDYLEIIKQIKK